MRGRIKGKNAAPRSVNSAILFVYRTGYAYGKEPEGFQKAFLSRFSIG